MLTIISAIYLKYSLTGGSSVFGPAVTLDLELITPDAVKIHDSNSPPKIILKNKRYENRD
jgi:hypothetical protein